MSSHSHDPEPFDITNCDREPIHALGAVQSFGYLIALSSDWIVVHTSDNIENASSKTPDDLLGLSVIDLFTDKAVHDIRTRLQWLQLSEATERLFNVDLFGQGVRYDVAVSLSGTLIVIEFEPCFAEQTIEAVPMVRTMTMQLAKAKTQDEFLTQAARQVRFVTDFDRVMIYRFLSDDSGEVVAEAKAAATESYLGLRYPASDIPKQARALYLRNALRLIADVDDTPSKIVPTHTPEGEPLDLSMSVLRSVSPIHLEYLRNMGVQASMSISIIVDGALWGLIACHHFSPKLIGFERRTVCELFGQLFALELANRERYQRSLAEREARAVHDKIMSTMAMGGSVFNNLNGLLDMFRQVISADGVAVWINGEFASEGKTLTHEEMTGLIRFLNRTGASRIYATSTLSKHYEPATDYAERVSGVLAIPVSRKPRDYLVLTRAEVAKSVTWAGDPGKPVEVGPNGIRLTPRKSFEAWQQVVHGTSESWNASELEAAEALRTTLLEIILRSVDESEKIRKQAQATQDLLIAELNHRVRNILGLVRGIVSQTGDSAASVADFSLLVGDRIQSLARAHDQLTAQNWEASSLRAMIQNEVNAYLGDKSLRVNIEGAPVLLNPQAFTSIALVIHELVTNSAKYGALSDSGGQIAISWQLDETGSLILQWEESGGPPVKAPTRRGFGSTIIERSIPFELGGEADIDFVLTGLRARFVVPGRFIEGADGETDQQGASTTTADQEPQGAMADHVDGGSVLLVEDNVIIALDAEDILRSCGFESVTTVSTVNAALKALQDEAFDLAVLDINLGAETSLSVAEELQNKGIPYFFASGYGDTSELPDAMNGCIVVTKPYAAGTLSAAIAQAMAKT